MNFAVIGSQVEYSLSPLLHNWIYKNLNLNHSYNYIKVADDSVNIIVDKIKNHNLDGANITMPFKQKIISHINELDDISIDLGAVNCISIKNNYIKGYNTDLFGFQKLIEVNKINLNSKNILVLGSGGSSRAILAFLKQQNANFSIFNRSFNNSDQLLNDLSIPKTKTFDKNTKDINLDINMIINCLPATVDYGFILRKILPNVDLFHVIIDINYYPINSQINSEIFIDGIDMFIYQAIKSNEIWMNKNILNDVDYDDLKTYILGQIRC